MAGFDEPAKFELVKNDSFEVNSSRSTTDTNIFASIRIGRNRSGAVPEKRELPKLRPIDAGVVALIESRPGLQ